MFPTRMPDPFKGSFMVMDVSEIIAKEVQGMDKRRAEEKVTAELIERGRSEEREIVQAMDSNPIEAKEKLEKKDKTGAENTGLITQQNPRMLIAGKRLCLGESITDYYNCSVNVS
jgi:hypothetical protein